MTGSQKILAQLWWGPLRRPFEAVLRRTVRRRSKILSGPLRGYRFTGGLSQTIGVYELPAQQALCTHLQAGDVFYDVGANNGYMTLLGGRQVGPQGQVFAFEPLPTNVASLRKVLSENVVSNCTLVPKAVSRQSGTNRLFFGSDTTTPSLRASEDRESIEVEAVSLDDFIRTYPAPAVVKLDVEGAEVDVLQGAGTLLRGVEAPVWLVETHTEALEQAVEHMLGEAGYRVRSLDSLRRQTRTYPRYLIAWKEQR